MIPEIVGGLIDQTSGTLRAPDADLSIKLEITRHLANHLEIVPTDDGASGQYTVQVKKGQEVKFKRLFEPFIIGIQNHGRDDRANYVVDKVNDAYMEKDSKTFLNSNLLRTQIGGFFENLKDGRCLSDFIHKGFSETGAARTIALDVKILFTESFCKKFLKSIGQSS